MCPLGVCKSERTHGQIREPQIEPPARLLTMEDVGMEAIHGQLLADRVALVTGGGGGIGAATARLAGFVRQAHLQ